MSTYHVSFFKNLLSSDGHPFKCLQRRIDVSDAERPAQAAESASRAFEALYGCPWKLHADSIEVIAARPVAHKTAAHDGLAPWIDRRHGVARRQRDELLSSGGMTGTFA
jgi:hypothetical protein